LHGFDGKDGDLPIGVVMDAAGNLYGSTSNGGANNDGTVFKLAPPGRRSTVWALTTLHSFGSALSDPTAGVILDKAGNLYGTVHGGPRAGVFRLSPPVSGGVGWTFTLLHEFIDSVVGGPDGGLAFDAKGNLYGTTSGGNGHVNHGVVFRLAPPARGNMHWPYGVLRAFNHTDGDFPGGGNLIFDKVGNLYGTTDGALGQGNVFMLSPPAAGQMAWRETVLHNFMGGTSDGCFPWGSVIFDRSGKNLYGTTQGCGTRKGGTVYEIELPSR
jgi:uncharacterized repeat protein (TIGR03803 family)